MWPHIVYAAELDMQNPADELVPPVPDEKLNTPLEELYPLDTTLPAPI
jgi:hypothetical protein